MSDRDRPPPERTVFRPSPLQNRNTRQVPMQPPGAADPPASADSGFFSGPAAAAPQAAPDYGFSTPQAAPAQPGGYVPAAPPHLGVADDVPRPSVHLPPRNALMAAAQTTLALIASVRANRASIDLPRLHRQVTALIDQFDASLQGRYPEEVLRRARYALCATADDVAMNVRGLEADAAVWAQRSMSVRYFKESIGGDRFWRLLEEMIASPAQNRELLELYHACMAAGMEGRYRHAARQGNAHHEMMQRVFRTLDFTRSVSATEVSPRWRGSPSPVQRASFWAPLAFVGGATLLALILVYGAFRIILGQTGQAPSAQLAQVSPDGPLRLSRTATALPPPADGAQVMRLRQFLAPEIEQGLVVVVEDASSVRVRTTAGTLFEPASDQLVPARLALFNRIARAIETEPGPVLVEGYTDSDRVSSAAFPDNQALSQARAATAAAIIRQALSDPARVTVQGFGDASPVADNDTAEGKAKNRRVEIVIQRGAGG